VSAVDEVLAATDEAHVLSVFDSVLGKESIYSVGKAGYWGTEALHGADGVSC
jgi:hypothetical protein